jgi:hypothetical protein
MGYQAKSKIEDLKAAPGPRLCATVYFPTDRHGLDNGDRRVIRQVAEFFRPVSLARRVELVVVGFADHRGSWQHNILLGARRARSVSEALETATHGFPNLSVVSVFSVGELFAAQGAPNAATMARNRKVEIWDGVPPEVKPAREPRQVRRLGFIEIERRGWDPNSPGGDEPSFGDAAAMILDRVLEKYKNTGKPLGPFLDLGTIRSFAFGSVPATHRVNTVRIESSHAVEIAVAGDTTVDHHRIYYTWGPQKPFVTIMRTFREFRGLDDGWRPRDHSGTKYSSKDVPRRVADENPFLFPPGEWAFLHATPK